jgi:hypothetical protein
VAWIFSNVIEHSYLKKVVRMERVNLIGLLSLICWGHKHVENC